MAVAIQPMDEYVVVQAEEAKTTTASGLYIPDSAQEKPKTAKVIAVGSDVKSVKVGDNIIYKNEYEATNVKVGKEDYTIVYKKNIIAIAK